VDNEDAVKRDRGIVTFKELYMQAMAVVVGRCGIATIATTTTVVVVVV
jgi:hypothetical protein